MLDASHRKLHYGRFAPVYDLLGKIWTGGQIRASKLSQIEEISAGNRVLYVGCGTGEDALAAAKKGAHVVIVELAPEMLKRTQSRFVDAKLEAEFICADAGRYSSAEGYDVVAANFFLNIFERPVMERMALHLAAQLRPGGKLLIADFAPPSGGFFSRLGAQIHHALPLIVFAVMVNQPIHNIYDYRPVLRQAGLDIRGIQYFSFWGNWSRWILSITAAAEAKVGHRSRIGPPLESGES